MYITDHDRQLDSIDDRNDAVDQVLLDEEAADEGFEDECGDY